MARHLPCHHEFTEITLHHFRKSITGLSLLVQQAWGLNPFDVTMYVFVNRGRDKIKILLWEKNDFVLWYKRLEKQRFKWPSEQTTGQFF